MAEKGKQRQRAKEAYSINVSAFPSELWEMWNKECQEHYSDCRWIKMWSDHLRAKNADKIEELTAKVNKLEMCVAQIGQEKPKDEGFVETMGGKVKKGGD